MKREAFQRSISRSLNHAFLSFLHHAGILKMQIKKLRRFRTPTKRLFQSLIKKISFHEFPLTFVRDFCKVHRLQMLPSEKPSWLPYSPCTSFSRHWSTNCRSRSGKLYYGTECREIQFYFPISTLYQRVNDAYKWRHYRKNCFMENNYSSGVAIGSANYCKYNFMNWNWWYVEWCKQPLPENSA